MKNELKLELYHENYFFESGIESYESLNKTSNDKYQYILPYYNFDRILSKNYFNGTISINSSGNNDLNETNVLKTQVINNINYTGFDIINDFGLKNNLNIDNLISKIKNNLEKKFISEEDILITRERHRQHLLQCVEHLKNFLDKNDKKDFDKGAEDLRLATRQLGMIVGKVDVEEILGSIFNDFCIGK